MEHTEQVARLTRHVRILTIVCTVLGIAVAGTIAWIVSRPDVAVLPEVITAQRLEILEPNGERAIVLANSEHPVHATIDGTVLLEDQDEERRNPTIIFFDGKGDEVGGMMFSNEQTGDGFRAVRHFAMDGYKQDETVTLSHRQTPEGASTGLQVSDRPERSIHEVLAGLGLEAPLTRAELDARIEELREAGREDELQALFGARRVFLGSNTENEALLVLEDAQSRPRIEIGVPPEGKPYIRILDEEGNTISELPE